MQAIEAEQELIGMALLDDSIMPIVEHVKPEHFADPLHSRIWEICLDVSRAGRKISYVVMKPLLGDALTKVGDDYLAKLCDRCGPVQQAPQMASTIINAWQVRAIAESVQGIDSATSAPEVFAYLRKQMDEIELAAGSDDGFVDAQTAADGLIQASESAAETGKGLGMLCGLKCIDERLGGFQRGHLVVIGGRPAMGKAQPLDSKVLLQDGGWAEMGSLRLGDKLASIDGSPSRVVGVYPQGVKKIYRVTLSDGRSAKACGDHLWGVHSSKFSEGYRVVSTDRIADMLTKERYKGRISLPLVSGHFGHNDALPIDPWLLGVLIANGSIADGSVMVSTADASTLFRLQEITGYQNVKFAGGYDYRINANDGPSIKNALKSCGLWGTRSETKFIPAIYLSANRHSRLELLRGLMDTDGWVESFGSLRYATSSPQLAKDVQALVWSLGGRCTIAGKRPFYTINGEQKSGKPSFVLNISHADRSQFVSLLRKRRKCSASMTFKSPSIVSVEYVGDEPAQCIKVTGPNSLYVTDDYIVTHNTALADNLSYGVARHNPDQTFVFFNLEMDASELSARQLSAHAYANGEYIQYRELKRPTASIVNRLAKHRASLPKNLLICDRKRISVDDVRRIIWKLKAKRQVGAVFIDYLQLMQMPSERGKTDAKIIAEATAELKRIAGEAQVCIVLLSQLNRGLEARDNKRPQMSDLRDSGGIEQDANAILFPYREFYYLKNEPPKDANKMQAWKDKCDEMHHVMTVICAKNRAGEVGDDQMYCSLGYDVILNEPPYDVGRDAA